ncbi:MAG TPA: response regulator transcription factor [Sediminibacterium sp.]|jgi:DNA-binding NarL/FixJ family response regulator|nr:response regulator transcription factor [Sediminibacterium sp.]
MIHVGIAEDNLFALKAIEDKLKSFEDLKIVFIAKNGEEAIAQAEKQSCIDLILMDIEMPVLNGIDATFVIKNKFPKLKIIVITVFDNDEYILNAINAGADSYILKETKAEKMYETIQDTLNGGAVMSPSVAVKALRQLKNPLNIEPKIVNVNSVLSERESEILEYLSSGMTNKFIADQLFISPFTVKRHIENIYQKLQARNRVDLLAKAKKNKLI